MDYDKLRELISAAASGRGPDAGGVTSRILAACWPGGSEDRTERAALEWVRRWRPQTVVAVVPRCSCVTGRCAACN
jgi:hypothetical protein